MPVDPRVLVVVPAFNAETTILETLQTILASTVPLRCVVVDPSSTDATPSLVAELARNDARLTYARVDLGGPGVTRRRGAEGASEEFLIFVDADDVWSPGCLEALVAALDANATAPLAVARFSTVDLAGCPVEVSSYPTWVDAPQRPVRLHLEASSVLDFATASSRLCFPPAGVLVRRSAYEAVGGFDPGVERSEDVFTWIKMTQLGSGVLATDAHFSYRVHDAQRSQSSGRGRGAIQARVLGLSVARDRSLLLVSLHGAIVTYATFARERISAGLRRRDAHALGGGLRNLAICGYLAGWALVWLVVPNAVRVRRFAGGIDRGLRRS